MSIPFSYPGAKPDGNVGSTFYILTGLGIFTILHAGTLIIECWGKGGRGADGTASNGGGGGGGGGYCKKTLTVVAGDGFSYRINSGSNSIVTSTPYSLNMRANGGSIASGTTGGAGGTGSGGDTNINGSNGANASGTTGGNGGNTFGAFGGSGGSSGNNGQTGPSPGAGGGGGGANASGSLGGQPQIKFTLT